MSTTAVTPHRVHTTVILAVLSIGGLAYAMLSSAVIPALPAIQHALGASEEGVTWLLTGYLLSASIATSILGRLGDMYGKERLLLLTLILLAVGTLVSALSTSLLPMVVGRVIQGAGGGIFPSPSGSSATSSRVKRSPDRSGCCRRSSGSAVGSGSCSAG